MVYGIGELTLKCSTLSCLAEWQGEVLVCSFIRRTEQDTKNDVPSRPRTYKL